MTDINYESLYLHLFNRITDITESLKAACETGDELSRDKAVLSAIAALYKAQSDTEEMYLSQHAEMSI